MIWYILENTVAMGGIMEEVTLELEVQLLLSWQKEPYLRQI